MPPGMLEEKYDEFTTHCFINHEYPADQGSLLVPKMEFFVKLIFEV